MAPGGLVLARSALSYGLSCISSTKLFVEIIFTIRLCFFSNIFLPSI